MWNAGGIYWTFGNRRRILDVEASFEGDADKIDWILEAREGKDDAYKASKPIVQQRS